MTVAEPLTGAVDFSLSEEQELLREQVRRYAEEEIAPGEAERDRKHRFPRQIVDQLGELGLLGMLVEEEHGGGDVDLLTYCLAVEELARISPSVAVTMSVTNSVCCWPISRFGSRELKARVLPRLAGGEAIGGFGLTEPGAGSDPGGMRTTARRDGDAWVLDGEKAWITNAGFAEVFVVVAVTDPEAGKRGLSAFVVPADADGFSVGQPPHPDAGRYASQAKLYASEAANRAVAEGVQIHGGNGFHADYEISRLYRDVRVTTIYEGTSEMQRFVIARRLLS